MFASSEPIVFVSNSTIVGMFGFVVGWLDQDAEVTAWSFAFDTSLGDIGCDTKHS